MKETGEIKARVNALIERSYPSQTNLTVEIKVESSTNNEGIEELPDTHIEAAESLNNRTEANEFPADFRTTSAGSSTLWKLFGVGKSRKNSRSTSSSLPPTIPRPTLGGMSSFVAR